MSSGNFGKILAKKGAEDTGIKIAMRLWMAVCRSKRTIGQGMWIAVDREAASDAMKRVDPVRPRSNEHSPRVPSMHITQAKKSVSA
jgi:hypothetical protein